MQDWNNWYVSEEFGAAFVDKLQTVKPPVDDLIKGVAMLADGYAFGPENGIVLNLNLKCTPEMAKNPLYQADQPSRPIEPEFSMFWTTTDSQERPPYAVFGLKDNVVSGLLATVPGRIWKHMTGHLTKIQSPINKSYFENLEYVKVPGFWSSIMNVHQLQHALAGISEKTLSKDGWTDMDPREFPPELNQDFDTSLLYPPEKIPMGNASSIAVINYVVRVLQIMICESNMFKKQLMWDQKFQSWRLVFAMVPGSLDTPPTFYNVTWKKDQYGKWKTMNTPLYPLVSSRISAIATHLQSQCTSSSIAQILHICHWVAI